MHSEKDPEEGSPTAIVWENFKNNTTAHAIPHVNNARGAPKKVFWLLLSVVCLVGLGYNIHQLAVKYMRHGVLVKVSVIYDKDMTFPAVTVCNNNPLKDVLVRKNPALIKIMDEFTAKKRRKRGASTGKQWWSNNQEAIPKDQPPENEQSSNPSTVAPTTQTQPRQSSESSTTVPPAETQTRQSSDSPTVASQSQTQGGKSLLASSTAITQTQTQGEQLSNSSTVHPSGQVYGGQLSNFTTVVPQNQANIGQSSYFSSSTPQSQNQGGQTSDFSTVVPEDQDQSGKSSDSSNSVHPSQTQIGKPSDSSATVDQNQTPSEQSSPPPMAFPESQTQSGQSSSDSSMIVPQSQIQGESLSDSSTAVWPSQSQDGQSLESSIVVNKNTQALSSDSSTANTPTHFGIPQKQADGDQSSDVSTRVPQGQSRSGHSTELDTHGKTVVAQKQSPNEQPSDSQAGASSNQAISGQTSDPSAEISQTQPKNEQPSDHISEIPQEQARNEQSSDRSTEVSHKQVQNEQSSNPSTEVPQNQSLNEQSSILSTEDPQNPSPGKQQSDHSNEGKQTNTQTEQSSDPSTEDPQSSSPGKQQSGQSIEGHTQHGQRSDPSSEDTQSSSPGKQQSDQSNENQQTNTQNKQSSDPSTEDSQSLSPGIEQSDQSNIGEKTNVQNDLSQTKEEDPSQGNAEVAPEPQISKQGEVTGKATSKKNAGKKKNSFLLKEAFMEAVSDMSTREKELQGYEKEDFILNCEYGGYDCNITAEFDSFYNNMYGNCYTFNWARNAEEDNVTLRTATRPGPLYGLKLIFNIHQDEYIAELTEAAGVRVVIHPQERMPFPEDEGLSIAPGQLTNIGLRMIEVERKGSPYGNCTDIKNANYKINMFEELYGVNYSSSACYKTCYQGYVIDRCDCADAQYPFYAEAFNYKNVKACSTANDTQTECKEEVANAYHRDELPCQCPQPCTEKAFTPTVSTTRWPAYKYEEELRDTIAELNMIAYSLVKAEDPNRPGADRFGENFAKVIIYFEEFNYENIKEYPEYELFSFVSDLGGVLGLYVGFSLLTIMEFVELVADLILKGVCATKRGRKVRGLSFAAEDIAIDTLSRNERTVGREYTIEVEPKPTPPPPYKLYGGQISTSGATIHRH